CAGMNKAGLAIRVQSVHADDFSQVAPRGSLVSAQNLQKVLPDVAIVLLGKTDRLARVVQVQQELLVDRRHIHYTDVQAAAGALGGSGQRLMDAAATAHDDRRVAGAPAQEVASPEVEREIVVVEHRGRSAHDPNVNQAPVTFHDPLHDGEQLSRAGDIDDPQVRQTVEDGDIVVAHVGCAVGPGL